jgi:hypothetical protein
VDELQPQLRDVNVAVLYIFCDYQDRTRHTDENLFASLVKQSIMQQRTPTISSEAKALYSKCNDGQTSPSLEQYLDLLATSIGSFKRTFVVVDGLDELISSEGQISNPQIPFLTILIQLQRRLPKRCAFDLFITSRKIRSIEQQLPRSVGLEIVAHEEDIRLYLRSQIFDIQKFRFAKDVQADHSLADKIVKTLVSKAQGM